MTDRLGALAWRRGSYYRGSRVTPVEGRDLSSRQTQYVVKDLEIGKPINSDKCSEAADGVARESVKSSWSGLPVVIMRPTVFLDGFFRLFAAPGVRDADELALPMGSGKTSPISAVDVARAVSVILDDPTPHIGQI